MSEFISDIKLYWQPYVFSQIARGMLSVVFFAAFVVNTITAIKHPNAYLEYADQAIPVYSDFIHGWFSQHPIEIVLAIAAGQALIAIGMSLRGWLMRGACIGSILFLLSIAPLMVGSASRYPSQFGWSCGRMMAIIYGKNNPVIR